MEWRGVAGRGGERPWPMGGRELGRGRREITVTAESPLVSTGPHAGRRLVETKGEEEDADGQAEGCKGKETKLAGMNKVRLDHAGCWKQQQRVCPAPPQLSEAQPPQRMQLRLQD